MGTLTRAPSCYVYTDNQRTRGEELGLTLSTAPGAQGVNRYTFFTSRLHRGQPTPAVNPFAVLPLFEEADPAAAVELIDHWLAYEESLASDSAAEWPAPDGCEYLPFQRAGIGYAMRRRHCLIGDEPGLGKTIQAIGVANAMEAERILVVCPASVRLQWAAAVEKWRCRPGRVYPILKSGDGLDERADVVITSYNLASSAGIGDAIARLRWDLVVFDEAHYLKSYDATRTRRLLGDYDGKFRGLVADAGRVLALTGTPLPNRPRECYTLARALDWDSIDRMSEEAFQNRYNPIVTMPNGFRMEWTGHELELQARLRCNFMVRRAKAAVQKDLPEKVYELAYIEPDGAVKKALRAEKMLNIDTENLAAIAGDAEVMGQIATVRRMMGDAKVPGVVAHLNMLLDGGVTKLVVFAYHTSVIAALREAFGPAAVVIQGATGAGAREAAKQRFQDDPDCRIFIGQLTAAGTGVDGLQNVCSHAVFAEASWTPGENEQCVDRLHRIGQRSAVVAQFLVAPGSLDARILGSAITKATVINKALDAHLKAC